MTENQPTIAEPVPPHQDGTGSAETPGTGSASGGPSYGPPPPYAPPLYPPYAPQRPPLRRSRTDRVLSGVSGGIAHSLGIDPVLVRILWVVGTLFTGGALIIGYIVAWVLMPEEPAYAVAPVAAPQYAAAGAPVSYAAGGTGTYVDPGTGAVYGPPTPVGPAPRTEPRSYLGWIVVSAALGVGGLFALAAAFGASVDGLVVLAAMLGVLGIGLLVGAFRGRARWLIAPALVLLLVVQGTAAVHGIAGGSGVGERTWVPTQADSSFDIGAGSARLDLTKLPSGDASVSTRMGAGELIVLVPAGTTVVVDAQIGLGEFDRPGVAAQSGVDLSISSTIPSRSTTLTTVDLNVEIGAGTLEVRYATP